MRCSSVVGTGHTPAKGTVDPSSVDELVHNLAGVVVRILDSRELETHGFVAVVADRKFPGAAGRSFPGAADRTAGHVHLELHAAPAAAHHKFGLQTAGVQIRPCYRKWSQ